MRALSGLLAAAALVAAPASAHASEPLCAQAPVDMAEAIEFQKPLVPYLSKITLRVTGETVGGEAGEAAQTVLGGQFVQLGILNDRKRWFVTFSPGPHDAASARAAIRSFLAARLDPAVVDYLDGLLLLLPTPYSRAELEALHAPLYALLQNEPDVFSSFGLGCRWSDAVRVEVGVGPVETPELRAHVESVLAPFGDKVFVRYGQGWAAPVPGIVPDPPLPPAPVPEAVQQRPTPKVRELVSLPRTSRCARTVGAKAKRGAGVKRVRLQIGKRVSAGKAPRLKLKSKRSKVTVTVTLRDGRSPATETLTYRRCA